MGDLSFSALDTVETQLSLGLLTLWILEKVQIRY